ncbi:MAG: hypothetical protein AAF152_11745 [Cyanobacteria bacterium P01_A01_bin.114]
MFELAVWSVVVVILATGAIGGGYWVSERIVGHEAARRNLRYGWPWVMLGFAIAFLTSMAFTYWGNLLGWRFFPLILPLLFVLGVVGWLLSWQFRKRSAGDLLLNAGRPPQSRFLFWIGLFEVAMAIYMTATALFRQSLYSEGMILNLTGVVFWWTLAAFFLALGLSRLEFRKNGICFMYAFIPWVRMTSYGWEASKSNTLTIRLQSRLPVLPSFMSISVPERHRSAIDRIVSALV